MSLEPARLRPVARKTRNPKDRARASCARAAAVTCPAPSRRVPSRSNTRASYDARVIGSLRVTVGMEATKGYHGPRARHARSQRTPDPPMTSAHPRPPRRRPASARPWTRLTVPGAAGPRRWCRSSSRWRTSGWTRCSRTGPSLDGMVPDDAIVMWRYRDLEAYDAAHAPRGVEPGARVGGTGGAGEPARAPGDRRAPAVARGHAGPDAPRGRAVLRAPGGGRGRRAQGVRRPGPRRAPRAARRRARRLGRRRVGQPRRPRRGPRPGRAPAAAGGRALQRHGRLASAGGRGGAAVGRGARAVRRRARGPRLPAPEPHDLGPHGGADGTASTDGAIESRRSTPGACRSCGRRGPA